MRSISTQRWLRAIGTSGSILALVILGASALIRLTTIFGTDGEAIPTLTPTVETTTRLFHRLAASGVGLLAFITAIMCWTRRPMPARFATPITLFIGATMILALIGPLTPGYRVAIVTIGNVTCGTVLLMAFWWLREAAAADSASHISIETLLRATIIVVLVHVATGAAASAYEMHGVRGFAFLHLGTALLSTMFIGASLWNSRRDRHLRASTIATAGIMAAQLALGFSMMWLGARSLWLAFLHAMLAPMLAAALVSMSLRNSGTRSKPLP